MKSRHQHHHLPSDLFSMGMWNSLLINLLGNLWRRRTLEFEAIWALLTQVSPTFGEETTHEARNQHGLFRERGYDNSTDTDNSLIIRQKTNNRKPETLTNQIPLLLVILRISLCLVLVLGQIRTIRQGTSPWWPCGTLGSMTERLLNSRTRMIRYHLKWTSVRSIYWVNAVREETKIYQTLLCHTSHTDARITANTSVTQDVRHPNIEHRKLLPYSTML